MTRMLAQIADRYTEKGRSAGTPMGARPIYCHLGGVRSLLEGLATFHRPFLSQVNGSGLRDNPMAEQFTNVVEITRFPMVCNMGDNAMSIRL